MLSVWKKNNVWAQSDNVQGILASFSFQEYLGFKQYSGLNPK